MRGLIAEDYVTNEGDFVINMGPQHPSTHGVLHLKIWLNGEVVKRVQPHMGYIHRSIEKMSEYLSYRNFIFATSRMDYLAAHVNNEACALAVEKGLGIEAPPRAKYVRTILSELTRLASHQLWWGCTGLDLGGVTPFFYAFREREAINAIMEETCVHVSHKTIWFPVALWWIYTRIFKKEPAMSSNKSKRTLKNTTTF